MAPKQKDAGDTGKARPAKKAKVEATGPTTDDEGWTLVPPSLIHKAGSGKGSSKIAAFDLDGTLVTTQSGLQFARTANDWQLFNTSVEAKVKEYVSKGYKIVIFSNQGAIRSAVDGKMAQKTKQRMDAVVAKLGVPVQIFMALQKDEYRKPETGMWQYMVEHCNDGIQPDLSASLFVGDFAGRPTDPNGSDVDKAFAANVGVKFYLPEEFFGASGPEKSSGPNAATIDVLMEMASLLKAKGEAFRGNALAKAASSIKEHGEELTTKKEAMKLPGVGKGSAGILEEIVTTGKCVALEELRAEGGTEGKAKAKAVADQKAKSSAFKFL